MASRLVQVSRPEPLYLRAISPNLPVKRTSYQDSEEGEALIVAYKQDLTRRPSQTRLPPTRINDRTPGVVPVATAWTTGASISGVTRVKLSRTHE